MDTCWKCEGEEAYCYTCGESPGLCECSDEECNVGDCEVCASERGEDE